MGDEATSFGAAADEYDRARPSYPADAVDWILESGPRDIVELGAGTGIFTRLIADRAAVVAIEPDAAMLAKIDLPAVRTAIGTAEAIPVPDASADLVVAAQAWHWVDPARAVPEAARVLRPGGVLAMIWNARDHTDPWVAEFRSIVEDSPAEHVAASTPVVGEPFGAVERYETTWAKEFSRAGILDLVRSRSRFITASPDEQRDTLAAVEALLEQSGSEGIRMPYRTYAYRARLG